MDLAGRDEARSFPRAAKVAVRLGYAEAYLSWYPTKIVSPGSDGTGFQSEAQFTLLGLRLASRGVPMAPLGIATIRESSWRIRGAREGEASGRHILASSPFVQLLVDSPDRLPTRSFVCSFVKVPLSRPSSTLGLPPHLKTCPGCWLTVQSCTVHFGRREVAGSRPW